MGFGGLFQPKLLCGSSPVALPGWQAGRRAAELSGLDTERFLRIHAAEQGLGQEHKHGKNHFQNSTFKCAQVKGNLT